MHLLQKRKKNELIPSRIKPKTIKIGIYKTLQDIQHNKRDNVKAPLSVVDKLHLLNVWY